MSHPNDVLPPGTWVSRGQPDQPPITITQEQMDRMRARAEEFFRVHGPRPTMEDLLAPDQIARMTAAADAAAAADGRLTPTLAAMKEAREAAGLSLAAAAARAGVDEDTFHRLEGGRLADPTWRTLDRCAAAVGLTLTLTAAPAAR